MTSSRDVVQALVSLIWNFFLWKERVWLYKEVTGINLVLT